MPDHTSHLPRWIAALLVTLALGAACSAPEAGQVIAKQHRAPYTWVQPVCTAYNSQGMCSTYTAITHTAPERWVLTLRSGDHEGDREVTQDAFDRCQPGQTYPACAH
ncbi:MAG TPA: hypothetical protein VFV66_21655 [Nonomuraea sp.]|nr:hypothetical protein [Nonomuraea sp.]